MTDNVLAPEHCHAEEYIDPRELTPHPWSVQTYGLGTEDEQGAMAESVGTGIQHPLLVTGNDCHSGPNIILAGCRRHLGSLTKSLQTVPIKRVHGLSESQERSEIARDNLLDKLARTLSDYQIAVSEAALIEKYSVGQGHRTDITSVGINRGSGSAVEIVSRTTGRKLNGVRDRHKILSCPLTTPALTEAYRSGQCSRSRAAAILRRVEKDMADVLDKEGGLEKARAEVDRLIAEPPGRPPKTEDDDADIDHPHEERKDAEPSAASLPSESTSEKNASPEEAEDDSTTSTPEENAKEEDADDDSAISDDDSGVLQALCWVAGRLVPSYDLAVEDWGRLVLLANRTGDVEAVFQSLKALQQIAELTTKYQNLGDRRTGKSLMKTASTLRQALPDEWQSGEDEA